MPRIGTDDGKALSESACAVGIGAIGGLHNPVDSTIDLMEKAAVPNSWQAHFKTNGVVLSVNAFAGKHASGNLTVGAQRPTHKGYSARGYWCRLSQFGVRVFKSCADHPASFKTAALSWFELG